MPAPSLALPDAEAFRRHAAALTARNIRIVCVFIVVLAALTPLPDPIVFAELPQLREPLQWLRAGLAANAVACYVLLRFTALARRPLVVGVYMAFSDDVLIGYVLGGVGDLGTPWFHFSYAVEFWIFTLVVPLRTRVLLGAGFIATVLLGLALARPGVAADPMLPPTVGFLVYVTSIGVGLSHVMYLLVRGGFLQEQARRRSHLERTREEERARIARELHDELGQELAAMRYALAFSKQRYERDPHAIAGNLHELDALLARATETTRSIVSELRPRVLDDLGLEAAIQWLVRRTEERWGLECRLSGTCADPPPAPDVSTAAFRILQESLTNVVRHAQARRAWIDVSQRDGALQLVVRDDGVGIARPAPGAGTDAGMGILGMRERAGALGGEVAIERAAGGGTVVRVRLPAGAA